ncbi:MAG: conjugal transfer protein TraX [Oscillospiraceae bacterium]|nr:conjugal transfer protein TraX [Oscillospiraceae bacterium]MBR2889926.1 conjugal transfer protein TraX [Oscillospiraceae bacterium]
MKQQSYGISATTLRLFALGCMLLDHLWATVVPGNDWMNYLGRLAFPIFAFQLAEGYLHTRNYEAYRKRLLIFALISEIPFNLMLTGSPIFPFHQNVMLTLLLGLMAIHQLDVLDGSDSGKVKAKALGKLGLIGLAGVITFPDYGLFGILNMVGFYVLRNKAFEKPLQLLLMVVIHWYGYQGMFIPLLDGRIEFPIQAFAILALIPIWLYNGQRGKGGKTIQQVSYWFYPVHMLLLGLSLYL